MSAPRVGDARAIINDQRIEQLTDAEWAQVTRLILDDAIAVIFARREPYSRPDEPRQYQRGIAYGLDAACNAVRELRDGAG
jgi:hypothetical protein